MYQDQIRNDKHREILYDYHYIESFDWKDFKTKVDKKMNHERYHNNLTYRVTLEDYQTVFNPLAGKMMHVGLVRVYRNFDGGQRRKPGE